MYATAENSKGNKTLKNSTANLAKNGKTAYVRNYGYGEN